MKGPFMPIKNILSISLTFALLASCLPAENLVTSYSGKGEEVLLQLLLATGDTLASLACMWEREET